VTANRTVLVQVNSLDLGGTQLNAVDFARAVEPLGYRSVLFGPLDTLPASGPDLFGVAAERGVDLRGYDRTAGVLSGRAQEMAARADAIGADLVHVYGTWGEPRTAYWGPCRLGRRPFVHTVYEMSVSAEVHRHTSLVVGTRYLAEELVGRPGPTAMISPPVDLAADAPNPELATEFRRQLGELGERFLVVVVSRLDQAMKAYPVEVAIEAMRALSGTGVALVVVGAGDREDRLRALAARVNQATGSEVVRFAGAMPDPRAAYAAADVVLGMGSSAARALAFGRPLIVQGEGGCPELFEPASADSLFRRSFWSLDRRPSAAEELAGLIAALRGDPARLAELSEFGRAFATGSFGLAAMAERLASVYEMSLRSYGLGNWLKDLPLEAPELRRSLARRIPVARTAGS
jgi:glycosyltransferase involved in cell wall biosynthesis